MQFFISEEAVKTLFVRSISSHLYGCKHGAATPAPPGPVMEIIAGLHQGVSITLEERSYRVGAAVGGDLVLRDTGVAAEHAVIRVAHGRVRVEAVGGDIGVADHTLAKGHGCELRPPVELSVGDAKLRVTITGASQRIELLPFIDAGREWAARRPQAAIAVAGLVIAVASVVAVTAGTLPSAAPTQGDVRTTQPIRLAALGDINSLGTGPRTGGTHEELPRLEQVMPALESRVRAAGLTGLKVNRAGDRPLVTGTVSTREVEAWTAVQQWFDQSYGQRLTLAANVTVADGRAGPMLRPQAVWVGAQPYIIGTDGTHYYQGSTVEGGWTIREIGEEVMLIAKGSETLSIPYR
jgi:Inner membrane component of T3SS, cytoplasmic domain/Inner membrane component of T3SS, periplasmic domain